MASNTKYQAAPTRDSFEEPRQYTQAPPSYQQDELAGASAGPSYGTPRSEDDNIPDDFKYGTTVSEASVEIRMAFIRKVYTILTAQLLATTGLSIVSLNSLTYRTWIQTHTWMVWVSLIGAIGFMLLTFWKRKSYPTNLLFLSGFTAMEAYSVSVITSMYNSNTVALALVITLGIFVFLTLFAMQSKYDFTAWQPYLFGALWILILFGLIAMFFPGGRTMQLVYGGAAALIFSGYILVDTQMVMRHYHPEEEIAASISLYLDVLNLFLAILRILNSTSDN